MDAREVALLTLNACERQGGWSDGVLKKQLEQAGLDARDAALATQLCFGVQQNCILLDHYLSHYSNIPLKRMESKVVQILRIGLYQMLFLSRIPHSAAVNTSVNMTRCHSKNPRSAAMVNGILRNLERNLAELPEIEQSDRAEYLSVKYSHPKWLVDEWMGLLGEEECGELLAANNSAPEMTIQVNTCKISKDELCKALSERDVTVTEHPWLEDCLTLSSTGNVERLYGFAEGLFYVQDPASRLAIAAAAPQPGMRVLDVCAAPGGKSFATAIAMGGVGEIVSCDIHPHKKKLIQAGAQRLGFSCISAETADATVKRDQWLGAFDLVISDVPCSGLGVIRKKPDIRFKEQADLDRLPVVQKRIIENACGYVKPGGVLLYSTCTVRPKENEEIVKQFLDVHPEFTAEAFDLPFGHIDSGMITLWPHRHDTDGFFFAKLRRKV